MLLALGTKQEHHNKAPQRSVLFIYKRAPALFSCETEQKKNPNNLFQNKNAIFVESWFVIIAYKLTINGWICFLFYFWWRRWKLSCVIQPSLCSFEPALDEPGCEWIPRGLHKSKGISTHHSTITISMSWLSTRQSRGIDIFPRIDLLRRKQSATNPIHKGRNKLFVVALLLKEPNGMLKLYSTRTVFKNYFFQLLP